MPWQRCKPSGAWEQQAVLFDDAADLVFDIPADCDQTRSRDKNGPGPLALFALDLHFSVPADPDQLGQSSSVILIALIQVGREYRTCVASIDADDRKVNASELVLARHRYRIKTDTLCICVRGRRRSRRKLSDNHGETAPMGPDRRTGPIDVARSWTRLAAGCGW